MPGTFKYITIPNSNVTKIRSKPNLVSVKFPKGFEVEIEGHNVLVGGCRFVTDKRFVRDSKSYAGAQTVSLVDDPENPENVWIYENYKKDVKQPDGSIKQEWDRKDIFHATAVEVANGGKRWLSQNKATIKVPAESCKQIKERGYTIIAGPKSEIDGNDLSGMHWYCRAQGKKDFDPKSGMDVIKFQALKENKVPMYEDVKSGSRGVAAWVSVHDLNRASFKDRRNDAIEKQRPFTRTTKNLNGPATRNQVNYMKELLEGGLLPRGAFDSYPYERDENGIPKMSMGEANEFLNIYGDHQLNLQQKAQDPRKERQANATHGSETAETVQTAAPDAPSQTPRADADQVEAQAQGLIDRVVDTELEYNYYDVKDEYADDEELENYVRDSFEKDPDTVIDSLKLLAEETGDEKVADLAKDLEHVAQVRSTVRAINPQIAAITTDRMLNILFEEDAPFKQEDTPSKQEQTARTAAPRIAVPHAPRPGNWNQNDDQPKHGAR